MISNNITRMLEAAKARYQIFELPAEKISAIDTATILSISPEIVFKTIVILPLKGKPVLCLVSATQTVDLKKVASTLSEKKVHIASQAEAERITGLQTGGISPLALLNKGFRMIMDSSATRYEQIHISGGQRGLNIRINTEDLVKLIHPIIAPISSPLIEKNSEISTNNP